MNYINGYSLVIIGLSIVILLSSAVLYNNSVYGQDKNQVIDNRTGLSANYLVKLCPEGQTLVSGNCIQSPDIFRLSQNVTLQQQEGEQQAPQSPKIGQLSCPPREVGTPPGNCRPLPTN